MNNSIIYLDNASTTRVCPEAAEAALRVMTVSYGNPSSTHTLGREAKRELEAARHSVAKALGAGDGEVFFTSGGTESDNWAVLSAAEHGKRRGRHIITCSAEHEAVLKPMARLEAQGCEVTYLAPGKNGSPDLDELRAALREDTVLVSLMLVNNETGAVTDISAAKQILEDAGSGALLHTDAVQGFLKIPFTVKTLGADLVSVSAHKIHGPKGAGALFVRRGLKLPPLLHGGGQESGLRSGTEGLPQIAAFGEAARVGFERRDESVRHMEELRCALIARLTAENPGLRVIDGGAPHILSISLPGYGSEVLMNYLEAREIYVSKSSACKRGARSHVLSAMGLASNIIDGALRVSLSRYTTRDECEAFCAALTLARCELFKALR